MKPVALEVSTYDLAWKLVMFKIWTRGNKKHSKIKLAPKFMSHYNNIRTILYIFLGKHLSFHFYGLKLRSLIVAE